MKHRSNPKSKTKSAQPSLNSATDFSSIAKEPFEQEYKIIDAVITSALIAGIDPSVMDHVLIPSFLNVSANNRKISFKAKEKWIHDPHYLWQSIIESVLELTSNFDESIEYTGCEEIHNLKEEYNFEPVELNEMEFQKQLKRAQEVLGQALDMTATEDKDQNLIYNHYAIEKCLLLASIKSAVLQELLDETIYIKASHHIPQIFEVYSDLMKRS